MHLDHVDIAGLDAGDPERAPDQRLLGLATGRGKTVRRTILAERAAAYHCLDAVAIGDRVVEPLQKHDAAALAAAIAAG